MLLKYDVADKEIQSVPQICHLIEGSSVGTEIAFFESSLHMKWLYAKVVVHIVSADSVVVLSEKRYRWMNSEGRMIIGSPQALPVTMWKGTKQTLCSGMDSKVDAVDVGLEALILYISSSPLRFGETDTMFAAILDTTYCPVFREARLALPSMLYLKRMASKEEKAKEPVFSIT